VRDLHRQTAAQICHQFLCVEHIRQCALIGARKAIATSSRLVSNSR